MKLIVAAVAGLLILGGSATAALTSTSRPSSTQLQIAADYSIPVRALQAYQAASSSAPCHIEWQDLAAVGWEESGHGTHNNTHLADDGREVDDATDQPKPATSWAGAIGPMQFMPNTWAGYATDGNGDGQADINNVDDAAVAAAKLLCASHVDTNRADAIGSYNGGAGWRNYPESQAYVPAVIAYADRLPDVTAQPATRPANLPIPGQLEQFTDTLQRGWVKVGALLNTPRLQAVHELWARTNGVIDPATAKPSSSPYTPGATAGGLDPDFAARLARMVTASGNRITITSGYRSPAVQLVLWQQALVKYGSADAARQWVAPSDGSTCNSDHCRGLAADLAFDNDEVQAWAHANATRFGLEAPMSWEPWHFSLIKDRTS